MDKLIEAFKQIIHNAIQYTLSEGTIYVSTTLEQGEIIITIQDNGVGITENHLPHIFEVFYRAPEAKSQRGFGLGLTIAQRVIERHMGKIVVQSALEQGSLFKVHLPVRT